MEEKWECPVCGYGDNTGNFCDRCGEPRKKSEEFDDPAENDTENEYGALICCFWSSSSSGMMMNSDEHYSKELKLQKDGTALLTCEDQPVQQPTVICTYRADPDILKEIAAFAAEEDMASWQGLEVDRQFIPLDYSSSSYITLQYGAPEGTRGAEIRFKADAARWHGHGDAVTAVVDMLKRCETPDRLLSEKKIPRKGMGFGFGSIFGMKPDGKTDKTETPSEPGSRRCPSCGTEATGKFCPECGTRIPE